MILIKFLIRMTQGIFLFTSELIADGSVDRSCFSVEGSNVYVSISFCRTEYHLNSVVSCFYVMKTELCQET